MKENAPFYFFFFFNGHYTTIEHERGNVVYSSQSTKYVFLVSKKKLHLKITLSVWQK